MESNQLMLGNYLRYGSDIVTVTDINKCSIGYNGRYFASSDFFNPIPLTPEIMAKIEGCVKDVTRRDVYRIKVDEGFNILFYYNSGVLDVGGDYELDIDIKTVHRLQNVYFALTGKPLQITL